jgi:hypothetical protein
MSPAARLFSNQAVRLRAMPPSEQGDPCISVSIWTCRGAGETERRARRWRSIAPYAVHQLMNGLEDSLLFDQLPQRWCRRTRTDNPMERSVETLRMPLTPMGSSHDPPRRRG